MWRLLVILVPEKVTYPTKPDPRDVVFGRLLSYQANKSSPIRPADFGMRWCLRGKDMRNVTHTYNAPHFIFLLLRTDRNITILRLPDYNSPTHSKQLNAKMDGLRQTELHLIQ